MNTTVVYAKGDTIEDSFLKTLETYRGSSLYVVGVPGNSGDVLLQKGLEMYMREHGYSTLPDAHRASVIIIHGGGNIDDVWGSGITLFEKMATMYPGKNIIVAPSSCHFSKTDFASILNACTQEVYFFVREERSRKRLLSMKLNPNIHVDVAGDTAFLLAGTDYIEELSRNTSREHVLYAFRVDRESTITPIESNIYTHSLVDRVRYIRARRYIRNFLKQKYGQLAERALIDDVSYRDFDTFVDRIVRASEIYTDRLHVAILGALLGKPVYLYKTRYDKVEGVYERTLRQYPNVVPMF